MSNNIDFELIKRYKSGDNLAAEELMIKYDKLINRIAYKNKIKNTHLYDVEDLKQDLYIEFINVIDRFDINKNIKFITFLYKSLELKSYKLIAMNTTHLKDSWVIDGNNIISSCNKIGIQKEQITKELVKKYYPRENKCNEQTAEWILMYIKGYNTYYLDSKGSEEDGNEMYNIICDNDNGYTEIEEEDTINKIIEGIERTARRKTQVKYRNVIERDINIFKEIALNGKGNKELAKELDTTHQNVSRIFYKYKKYAQDFIKSERSLIYGL